MVWCAHNLAFDEPDVEQWHVVVHELEQEDLQGQGIVETALGPSNILINLGQEEEKQINNNYICAGADPYIIVKIS